MDFNQLAATGSANLGPLSTAIRYFIAFVDGYLVPLIFALAFISFLWGVYTYFFSVGADAEKRTKGKTYVLYGIIGFVLMVSLWGIVNIVTNTLGFNSRTRPALPLFGSAPTTQTTQTAPTNSGTTSDNFIQCLALGGTWNQQVNNGAGGCFRI